jgi:hypothetical protein
MPRLFPVQDRAGRDLDACYDAATVARLDRRARTRPSVEAPRPARRGWSRRTATGALVTGLALGLREVLAPTEDEPVIEEIDPNGLLDREQPVWFVYVAGAPSASRIVLRPWLLSHS